MYLGRGHRLANRPQVLTAELQDEVRVIFKSRGRFALEERQHFWSKPFVAVDDRETMKCLLAQNEGIALLPHVFGCNDPYVRQGLIKRVPLADSQTQEGGFYWVSSKAEPPNYLEGLLLEVLEEQLLTWLRD